ncbi:MAG: MBL fold metallo-hydrolase [Deltaproteobacteria bacterium]|nr:MBL fold metallo-hydrolase [Deltaproteobacteria bacterium]
MLFRQLFDPETSTYTYLLADEETKEAVLIDPVREQTDRDLLLLQELGLTLVHILETHVHADHVTGAGQLRDQTHAKTVVSAKAGAACADVKVHEGDVVAFGSHRLHVLETPGHTDGCQTYVTDDKHMAFTGDALLIRGCGRTDFQQGDARKLFHSVRDKIFGLPDNTLIYPGHDYKGRMVSTVAEEKKFNPRLGDGRTEDEFVELMASLKLATPKKIHEAVPANMLCGRAPSAWAPIEKSPSGVQEVSPEWVEQTHKTAAYRLVDVREPHELLSELGAIPGITNHPLAQVVREANTAGWDKAAPVVLVCRSGGRSGTAAIDLEKEGFTKVASMRGGMLAWRGDRTFSSK